MEKMIYLDNAATTFVDREVAGVINEVLLNQPYNPSSVYMPAVSVHALIEKARQNILTYLGFEGNCLIFTGSASEANNTALLKIKTRPNFVALIGATEHPAVYEMAEKLRKNGACIYYVPVDAFGRIDEKEYLRMIEEYPVKFVSIMHVNNENGAINDIKKLCAIAKEKDKSIIFHSDGVQAFGKIDVNLDDLGVDMYTICSHKINGPKGIGALCYKKNLNIEPLIFGGGQEFGLRSGTENVPYIIGFEKAASLKMEKLNCNYSKVLSLKKKFIELLNEKNIDFKIFSDDKCLPYILQIRFCGVRGEVLLHALEKYNIYISTGSACSSKKKTNRILDAMGKTYEEIQEVVRISFAPEDVDLEYVTDCLKNEILKLRKR